MVEIDVELVAESHVAGLGDVLAASFNGSPERYRTELERYRGLQPDGWLVATVGGRAVGVVGGIDYGAFSSIGYMAVHPSMRGKGVGQVLFGQLIRLLEKRGCPVLVLDATDAGAPLYRKFGFVDDGKTFEYEWTGGETEPFNVGGSENGSGNRSRRLATPVSPRDMLGIEQLDRHIFGADRKSVLELYIKDFANRTFVTRDEEGTVSGFLVAQSQRLGPWVARTEADAETLLRTALTLTFEGNPRVDAPEVNRSAVTLLSKYGFRVTRTLQHMCLGVHSGNRALLYGQTNLTLG